MTSDVRSRTIALTDVLTVTAVGVAIPVVLGRLGAAVAVGVLSIVVTLTIATLLLKRRGVSWSDLGCRRPQDVGAAAAWAIGLFLVDMLLIPPLTSMLANALGWPGQHLEAFADLRGNLTRYLVLLIPISWGSAAFGEELVFRGFVARRLSDAFGGTGNAELAATLGQAVLFALGHAYLGPRGMLNAGALGLVAGLSYRWNGRNLWPLFIAHGLVDSAGITALYLGVAHS
jgi:membrane protease YdiL (CAAX protease family)